MRIESTDMLASLPLIEVQRDDSSETDSICPVPDGETAWLSSLDFPHPGKSSIRITASALTQSLTPVSDTVTLEFTACDPVSPATIFTPDSLFSFTLQPESLYRPAPVIVDTASTKVPQAGRFPNDYSVVLYTVFIDGVTLRVYNEEFIVLE